MRAAVFLDRDGVINRCTVDERGVPHPPDDVGQFCYEDGAAEAVRAMKAAGFVLPVVTNQPDVARGTQTRAAVEAINAKLSRDLPVDGIFVCYHDNGDDCDCRKPKPGLLRQAAERLGIDLSASWMVGDRSGDVLAGAAVGARTILIDRLYSKRHQCSPNFVAKDLAEAAAIILRAKSDVSDSPAPPPTARGRAG